MHTPLRRSHDGCARAVHVPSLASSSCEVSARPVLCVPVASPLIVSARSGELRVMLRRAQLAHACRSCILLTGGRLGFFSRLVRRQARSPALQIVKWSSSHLIWWCRHWTRRGARAIRVWPRTYRRSWPQTVRRSSSMRLWHSWGWSDTVKCVCAGGGCGECVSSQGLIVLPYGRST